MDPLPSLILLKDFLLHLNSSHTSLTLYPKPEHKKAQSMTLSFPADSQPLVVCHIKDNQFLIVDTSNEFSLLQASPGPPSDVTQLSNRKFRGVFHKNNQSLVTCVTAFNTDASHTQIVLLIETKTIIQVTVNNDLIQQKHYTFQPMRDLPFWPQSTQDSVLCFTYQGKYGTPSDTKTLREADQMVIGWLSNAGSSGNEGVVESYLRFGLDREDGAGKLIVLGDLIRVIRDKPRMLVGVTRVLDQGLAGVVWVQESSKVVMRMENPDCILNMKDFREMSEEA